MALLSEETREIGRVDNAKGLPGHHQRARHTVLFLALQAYRFFADGVALCKESGMFVVDAVAT